MKCLGINCVITIVAGTEEFLKPCNSTLARYTKTIPDTLLFKLIPHGALQTLRQALDVWAHKTEGFVQSCRLRVRECCR